MKFQGALIKEQGITFGIAVVKRPVLNNTSEANRIQAGFRSIFGPVPIVLMAQDAGGRATFYGRRDIAQFLSNVPLHAIPWREYTLS
jgi:hypothetical protein